MIVEMACAFIALLLFGFGAINLAPLAIMLTQNQGMISPDKNQSVTVLLMTSLACFGLAIPLWYVFIQSVW